MASKASHMCSALTFNESVLRNLLSSRVPLGSFNNIRTEFGSSLMGSCGIWSRICSFFCSMSYNIILVDISMAWCGISSALAMEIPQAWGNFHWTVFHSQIAKFMGPTWGPPGSCRPQMGLMLAHEPYYQGCLTHWFGLILVQDMAWKVFITRAFITWPNTNIVNQTQRILIHANFIRMFSFKLSVLV